MTLEELINELLEIANKRGGNVKTNVESVYYKSPLEIGFPLVIAILEDK